MKKRTGNNQYLKQLNQKVVLDLIRCGRAVTKIGIAKETGLSATAVGMITSTLLEQDFLSEQGVGESKGGRRPTIMELKSGSYFAVGIDIDVSTVNAVLMDITGTISDEAVIADVNTKNIDVVVELISRVVSDFIEKHELTHEKLLGVGVSVPGMVEPENGIVRLAPNLEWQDVPLGQKLKEKLSCKVFLENEAMSSAICESWIGNCQNVADFVCINVKSGIGAGIFTNGKLYRGAGGTAGEVGHIVVDENGPKCGCGNFGCLETMSSTTHIVEKARRLIRQGGKTALNVHNPDEININDVIHAARQGDDAATSILTESARYLGIAASNIVNTLNPQKIIFGKEFTRYADIVMDTLRGVVERKALKKPYESVSIECSNIGEKTSTLGAAIIPIKEVFGR